LKHRSLLADLMIICETSRALGRRAQFELEPPSEQFILLGEPGPAVGAPAPVFATQAPALLVEVPAMTAVGPAIEPALRRGADGAAINVLRP
jgi:hypothetical protein